MPFGKVLGKSLKLGASLGAVLLLVGGSLAARPLVKQLLQPPPPASPPVCEERTTSRVEGNPNAIRVAPEAVKKLRVRTAPVEAAVQPEPLKLTGHLQLEPSRLARVHTRFAGEVVELGHLNVSENVSLASGARTIRPGDRVRKHQLLAVVWSKDLGEKKSEYLSALTSLWQDELTAKDLADLYAKGGTSLKALRDAERALEADRIAAEKAELTLRSWGLDDKQLSAVRAEAERVRQKKERTDPGTDWARVEILAPFDGVLLEMNVAEHDVVDTTLDLFKVGDLSRLQVVAQVFEDDLPKLQRLPAERREWRVQTGTGCHSSMKAGRFETIGAVVDPVQHTVPVMGWIDNCDGRLRVGQFVSVLVPLAPPADTYSVPRSALVEDGPKAGVFLQVEGERPTFEYCPVMVVGRSRDRVYVQAEGFRAGTPVVVAGAVELAAAWQDLPAPPAEAE